MSRLAHAASFLLAVAGFACNPIEVPDQSGSHDGGVGPDGAGGTCDPGCGENANCNSQDTCVCNTGYEGDGQLCEDVDECTTDNGGCDENALCINQEGSRSCICNQNFVGDGETCAEVWSLRGTLPNTNIDPENFGTLAVGAGARVYFGPRANSPNVWFFRSFDLMSGQFSAPLALPSSTQPDFCACGLGESFVAAGSNLYLLGNDGEVYQTTDDRWLDFRTYTDNTTFHKGEAGATFDAESNSILLFGGRENHFQAVRIDFQGGSGGGQAQIEFEPGNLPVFMDKAVAHSPPGMGLSFVANFDPDNGSVDLFSHPTGTAEWNPLTGPPMSLGVPLTMGHFGSRIWVASDSELLFYDPSGDLWNPTPLTLPSGTKKVVNVQMDSVVAIAQVGPDVHVYELVTTP